MNTKERNIVESSQNDKALSIAVQAIYAIVVGIPICIFTVIYFFSNQFYLASINAICFIVLVINLLILRKTKKFTRYVDINLYLGIVLLSCVYATGGYQNTGYLGLFPFLAFIFIISKSLSKAILAATLLLLSCLFITIFHWLGWFELHYSNNLILQVYVCFIITTGLLIAFYKYKTTQEKHHTIVARNAERQIEMFQKLVEDASDLIYVTDKTGCLIYANPEVIRILNVSNDEILKMHYTEFVHPEYREIIENFCNNMVNNNIAPSYLEFPIINSMGENRWIGQSVKLIYENNLLQGFQTVARDVTDRKKGEELLIMNEEKYKSIIENMQLGLLELDLDDIIIVAHDRFCTLTGYSKEELIGKSSFNVLYGEADNQRSKLSLQNLRRIQGKGNLFEMQLKKKNGDNIWVMISEAPLYDVNHVVNGSIGIYLDITERKKIDQALLNAKAIAEHADELAKINKELDQFAYIVSHDLKAPLRAIANLSEWIKEDLGDNLSEANKKNIELLQNRVNRMSALINAVLDYSRIGRIKVVPEEINLQQFLPEIIDLLAPPKNFKIVVEQGFPTFTTEKILLQQVFSNLISNAIKYNDKANGEITISHTQLEHFYEFTVSDNGPGISSEHHEKIFGIFQTLQAKDKVESTGIGLSIVKKIIDEHNGKIKIDSEKGSGAKFIFTWPKSIKNKEMESLNN